MLKLKTKLNQNKWILNEINQKYKLDHIYFHEKRLKAPRYSAGPDSNEESAVAE